MWILTKVICDEDYSVCSVKTFAFSAKDENKAKGIVIKQMQKDEIRKEDIKEFEGMDEDTWYETWNCYLIDIEDNAGIYFNRYKDCPLEQNIINAKKNKPI